jgi:hypothetical protein
MRMDQRKENFKRIAENRTNKILNMIQSLGNLKNRSFYDYTEDEIKAIFDAIQIELNTQKNLFLNDTKAQKKFKL